jgi:hypothetical protein
MMDPDYDGLLTAGWRGVIVNLRLDMEITRCVDSTVPSCSDVLFHAQDARRDPRPALDVHPVQNKSYETKFHALLPSRD